MSLNQFFGYFLLITFFSCGSGDTKEHKILHNAFDIHMEALKVKKELEPSLEELRQLNNSIQVQGRELSAREINFSKAISVIENRLNYWEENHVEVPGFEHEGHDHSGHNHSHDHKPQFQLPASDILIIQKEFRDSILSIKSKVGALLLNAPK